MKVDLIANTGPCGIPLKTCCLIIPIFFFTGLVAAVVTRPSIFRDSHMILGLIIVIIANLALLAVSLRENRWFLLVWLFYALLFAIGWPIAVFGVIFNFGNYRHVTMSDNVFLSLLEYIFSLIVHLYFARIVYSYFRQLQSQQTKPQHLVTV